MKRRSNGIIYAIVALLVCVTLWGGEGAEIKQRMRQRKTRIVQLKRSGVIGENNAGYLEIRKSCEDVIKLVKAENDDRAKVYSAIAAKEGTTIKKVAKRRALQIAEKAMAGEWLQKADGTWARK